MPTLLNQVAHWVGSAARATAHAPTLVPKRRDRVGDGLANSDRRDEAHHLAPVARDDDGLPTFDALEQVGQVSLGFARSNCTHTNGIVVDRSFWALMCWCGGGEAGVTGLGSAVHVRLTDSGSFVHVPTV